jgi:GntR family transcriptional regulator, transcriptional repressor for pyruvate dehydrogenase complex
MREALHLAEPRRRRAAESLVEGLVGLILEEGLGPGDKLPSERQLMARLDVGRSTIREAMKALSAVGIVEVVGGSGTFVADGASALLTRPLSWGLLMSAKNTYEVLEARRVVEVALAELAAQRGTDAEHAEIGNCLALMQANLGNIEAFARYDVEFHRAIARAAHNQVLYRVIDTLRQALHSWTMQVYSQVQDKPRLIAEHEPIYHAIRARDPKAASQAMLVHVNHGFGWLRDSVRQPNANDGEEDKSTSNGVPGARW